MKLKNEQLIKKWEALKLKAYLPTPNDVWTIGWGHTHTTKPGMTITREQAQELFEYDVAWAVEAVNKGIKVPVTQNQFDVAVSLCFNIGAKAFAGSTFLRRINAGDIQGAAEALTWWNKQKGKVLRGLVRRREDERTIFLTPDDSAVEEDAPKQSVKPDAEDGLKPLTKSKETVVGTITALVGAVGGVVGTLVPEAQIILSVALSVALLGSGAFFLWNRLRARNKGQR